MTQTMMEGSGEDGLGEMKCVCAGVDWGNCNSNELLVWQSLGRFRLCKY